MKILYGYGIGMKIQVPQSTLHIVIIDEALKLMLDGQLPEIIYKLAVTVQVIPDVPDCPSYGWFRNIKSFGNLFGCMAAIMMPHNLKVDFLFLS